MKFKILAGAHTERGKFYPQGSIIESNVALDTRFNQPGSIKFLRVNEETALSLGAKVTLPPKEDPNAPQPTTELEYEETDPTIPHQNLTTQLTPTTPQEAAAGKASDDGLEKKTVEALKQLAEERGYDLGHAKTKAEIVSTIREWMAEE